MRLQFDHLDQGSVGGESTQVQAVLDELLAVFVVDLVTMPMSLADLRCPVNRCRLSSRAKSARIGAEPHRTTHVSDVLLVFHQRDNGVVALRRKFAGMTVG